MVRSVTSAIRQREGNFPMYGQILAKLEWANSQIRKLDDAFCAFRRSHPVEIGRSYNSNVGMVTYYAKSVPVMADELTLMLGDTIHNLRSALDHLAFALVTATGQTLDDKARRRVCFPIFDTAEAYEQKSRECVPGVKDCCLSMLDRVEPYGDGSGRVFWQLHGLDIVDKHRLLLAVATVPVGRTMTPQEKSAFETKKTIIGPRGLAAIQYVAAVDKPPSVPLNVGYELGRFSATEVGEGIGFAFDLAINEPGILDFTPAPFFLKWVSAEIGGLLNDFAPYV